MRAVDAKLTAGDARRLAESLANVPAVHLIRHVSLPADPHAGGMARSPERSSEHCPPPPIEEHLDSGPTLSRWPLVARVSPNYFAWQFKRATGLPPYQYVLDRRVERAEQFLQTGTDISLAEVAAKAGFSTKVSSPLLSCLIGATAGQIVDQWEAGRGCRYTGRDQSSDREGPGGRAPGRSEPVGGGAAAQKKAKAAPPTWSATPLRERGALLVKLAEAIEAEQGQFARLLTEEQGKPLPQALDEIAYSIATLRYFATLDLPPEVLHEDAARKVVRLRKPLGVVAAIMPWNVPMILLAIQVAPALLAGNTVVAKPAPTTPLTTLKFGELCAGILPAEVVNIIVDQNDLGTALTSHSDVAKLAFTGSTATGKKVMASAAGTLKRLTLELGGQ